MRVSFIGGPCGFVTIGNVTRIIGVVSADSATVNSSFSFWAGLLLWYSGRLRDHFNGTVSARDSCVYSAPNSAWIISNETWSFTSFNIQN